MSSYAQTYTEDITWHSQQAQNSTQHTAQSRGWTKLLLLVHAATHESRHSAKLHILGHNTARKQEARLLLGSGIQSMTAAVASAMAVPAAAAATAIAAAATPAAAPAATAAAAAAVQLGLLKHFIT